MMCQISGPTRREKLQGLQERLIQLQIEGESFRCERQVASVITIVEKVNRTVETVEVPILKAKEVDRRFAESMRAMRWHTKAYSQRNVNATTLRLKHTQGEQVGCVSDDA